MWYIQFKFHNSLLSSLQPNYQFIIFPNRFPLLKDISFIIITHIMSKSDTFNGIVTLNPVLLAINKLFSHSKLLQNISTYFGQLFAHKIPTQAEKFFFTIGAVAITYKVLHSLYKNFNKWKWVPSHFSNRKNVTTQHMKAKYGDCYAVVTGCTEGIGLAYVIELARLGFGVVMVARNKQKLERRINQIKNLFPNFRYETIIADLSKYDDIKRLTQQLIGLANKIDIGIVINNAGHVGDKFQNYINHDVKLLKDILVINFLSVYNINSVLLPILRTRKHRSAILNLSSCTGYYISQGNGTYSSTKVMLDIYSRTLSIENRDKIDVLSVRPFGVKTPMMGMHKGRFMITPQDCVISSFADLGVSDTTWTGFIHKVQAQFFESANEEQRFEVYQKLFQAVNKQ